MNTRGIFTEINGPWVDAAAERGDLVTVVSGVKFSTEINSATGKTELTGFGKEIDGFKSHGHSWNADKKN